jgi:3-deoxy-D-manno-octulosonate 8-phosphate phosphatase (KDO 8-P phosphatase)
LASRGFENRNHLRTKLTRGGASSQRSKIEYVRQGTENKVDAFLAILALAEVSDSEVAFIGDDLNDIPLLQRAELAVAVANASEETRAVAHFVTQAKGGFGAVREVIELILKAQGRWAEVTEEYLKG